MVSAEFVTRHDISISKDESVLGNVRQSDKRKYQIDGYFVGSWQTHGVHDAHPGIFAVVVDSEILPQNVEVLLKPVENGIYEGNSTCESNSHMMAFHKGEPNIRSRLLLRHRTWFGKLLLP
jgi:hypothetical protein